MASPVEEIKKTLDELKHEQSEFQKKNDARLSEIEKKGFEPADFKSEMEKHDKEFEKLASKIEALEVLANKEAKEKEDDPNGDYREAKYSFQHYLRHKKVDLKLHEGMEKEIIHHWCKRSGSLEDLPEAIRNELKALSVNNDPEGGYLVRPTVSMAIGKRIFESSPMRQLADSITISSDAFEEPFDDDEFDVDTPSENGTRSETATNAPLKMITIPVHEISAMPKASQKLLDDGSIDMEAWLQGKLAARFGRKEASQFVTGTGVGEAKGILSYTAGTGFDQIEQVNSGDASLLTADGLIDLQGSLFEEFQGNASWLMKRATATAVRKLKGSDNTYLFSLDDRLNERFPMTILGAPVRFANDMPAVGAGNLPVAYGDFKAGYLIVDRIGMRVLRDPYTTKGQVKFYTTKRVGGGVRQYQAIKLQVVSA